MNRFVSSARAALGLAVLSGLLIQASAHAAAPQVGLAEPAFTAGAQRVDLTSSRPLADVVRCWRRDAEFAPLFSKFTGKAAEGAYGYSLKEGGRIYERITLTARDPSGSRAVIELSPAYDAGWSAMVEKDRLEPLRRCLGVAPVSAAAAF